MVILKTKTGVIPANETEIVFTDVVIEDNSIIEVYYDNNNVYTVETSQNGDSVKIITSPHDFQVGVKLLINNVGTFSPYNDTPLWNEVNAQGDQLVAIVDAMGELEGDIGENTIAINILDTRVDECFQSVSNGKSIIASAITDKGVETLATDTFQTMADNISQISGGGGTSLSFADAHYINGHSMNFISENTGYIYVVYNEVNSGNGNQVLKCNDLQIMNRTNWKSNGNQRTDFICSRVITGDVVLTNNTNYGSATRIVCCTSNLPPIGNIVNFDDCGCYFIASGGAGASTSQYSFIAKKSGVLHCNMAEGNVSNNGNVTINGVSASRTEIWQNGNVHGRYFTANVNEGDTVVVGCPPSNWYGSNSALRALCIII